MFLCPQKRTDDFLIIGGSPRSGTTLITEILNQAPDISIFAEYPLDKLLSDVWHLFEYEDEISRLFSNINIDRFACDDTNDINSCKRLIYTPKSNENSWATKQGQYPVKELAVEIIKSIFCISAKKPNIRLFGCKTPGFSRSYDIHSIIEKIGIPKFLIVIRDPLFAINSIVNRRNRARLNLDVWEDLSIQKIIDEYRHIILTDLAYSIIFKDRCHFIYYDSLIDNTADELLALNTFIQHDVEIKETWLQNRGNNLPIVLTSDEIEIFNKTLSKWRCATQNFAISFGERSNCSNYASLLFEFNNNIEISTIENNDFYKFGLFGWSIMEADGIWTIGRNALIMFRIHRGGDCIINLNASFCHFALNNGIEIDIYLNELQIRRFYVTNLGNDKELAEYQYRDHVFAQNDRAILAIGPIKFDEKMAYSLRINVLNPMKPSEFVASSDDRSLGLKLSSLALIDVSLADSFLK